MAILYSFENLVTGLPHQRFPWSYEGVVFLANLWVLPVNMWSLPSISADDCTFMKPEKWSFALRKYYSA